MSSATPTTTQTTRGQIAGWEARGYAGILDDAGQVHDRASLERVLTDGELDEPRPHGVWGWWCSGDRVPYGDGSAVGLTAIEVVYGVLLQPASIQSIRRAVDLAAKHHDVLCAVGPACPICVLRDEAATAGDRKQVSLCDRARTGDPVAVIKCCGVIEDAAAQ